MSSHDTTSDPLTALAPTSNTSTDPIQLLSLDPKQLDTITLHSSLGTLSDIEAISICSQLILANAGKVEDSSVIRTILGIGLGRAQGHIEGIRRDFEEKGLDGLGDTDKEILRGYAVFEEMRKRLDTFDIIAPPSPREHQPDEEDITPQLTETEKVVEEEMELDDPWSEDAEPDPESKLISSPSVLEDPWADPSSPNASTSKVTTAPEEPVEVLPLPISLATFLTQSIVLSTLEIAASASLSPLKIVSQRHHTEVYSYRFAIIQAIPGWVPPIDIHTQALLPTPSAQWLVDDGSESRSKFDLALARLLPSGLTAIPSHIPSVNDIKPDLTEWYTSHIISLDSLGLLDTQLAWVQYGASLGITSLDELGEDLSLLSRLAYDANLTSSQQSKWTLTAWRSAIEGEIISAYLSNSTPRTVVEDIKRLVMPYLYVLESRAERSGKSDPGLVERLLHEAILGLPLELALPTFESSKATLPVSERLVKNDLDVARLALAILYGSEERESHVWGTMSSIFECLPVWELSGSDPESDSELTTTTLESIATFIRPTRASDPLPKAKDLYLFFHPLPFASLSRALDILDVHLESGEILARWKTPVALQFLLQSGKNVNDQRELMEKLMRRQSTRAQPLNDDAWRRLWEDINRLAGGEDSLLSGALGMLDQEERAKIYLSGILSSGNFDAARNAIKRLKPEGVLDDDTVEKVVLKTSKEFYLSAESGNIHTGDMKLAYDCLSVATSPASAAINQEKKYIQATSRLSSFPSISLTPTEIRRTDPLKLISKVLNSSEDGYRHPELMLELADQLAHKQSNPDEDGDGDGDGGKNSEKGLVLGMIGRAAYKRNDWERVKLSVEGMIDIVKTAEKVKKRGRSHKRGRSSIGSTSSVPSSSTTTIEKTNEKMEEELLKETWNLGYSLCNQDDYLDITSKLIILGSSMELCPASEIPRGLEMYRKIEKLRSSSSSSSSSTSTKLLKGNGNGNGNGKRLNDDSVGIGIEEDRVLGSRTAARAAKLALDIGERFHLRGVASPLLGHGHGSASHTPILSTKDLSLPLGEELSRVQSNSSQRSQSKTRAPRELFDGLGLGLGPGGGGGGAAAEEAERVRTQARRALVRGVGWLLGAEEGEITG